MRSIFLARTMLGAAALFAATASWAAQAEYTNAELVSIDASTRMLVVKNNTGAEETLKLDDAISGLDGLKSGDRVILTVRGEPGLRRVSAVRKSTAEAAPARSSQSYTGRSFSPRNWARVTSREMAA